jgi:hypothetical protein
MLVIARWSGHFTCFSSSIAEPGALSVIVAVIKVESRSPKIVAPALLAAPHPNFALPFLLTLTLADLGALRIGARRAGLHALRAGNAALLTACQAL